jgi:rare lipoprotein A
MRLEILFVLLAAGTTSMALLMMNRVFAEEGRSGKATVYSDSFQGKKTANGERYDKRAVTAASPTLPLGSKVLVKDKSNGKSIVVKVNDRQPAGGHRVLDLSKAAADKLGVKGTAPVETKVLGK